MTLINLQIRGFVLQNFSCKYGVFAFLREFLQIRGYCDFRFANARFLRFFVEIRDFAFFFTADNGPSLYIFICPEFWVQERKMHKKRLFRVNMIYFVLLRQLTFPLGLDSSGFLTP